MVGKGFFCCFRISSPFHLANFRFLVPLKIWVDLDIFPLAIYLSYWCVFLVSIITFSLLWELSSKVFKSLMYVEFRRIFDWLFEIVWPDWKKKIFRKNSTNSALKSVRCEAVEFKKSTQGTSEFLSIYQKQ